MADTSPLRRRWVSATLAVLAGIATLAAGIGWWVHATVLVTDRFVALVEPIVRSPATADLVGRRVADRVVTELDLETRIADSLGTVDDWLGEGLGGLLGDAGAEALGDVAGVPDLSALASSLTTALEDRVERLAVDVVSRPGVSDALVGSVTRAHRGTVAVLRGDEETLPDAVDVAVADGGDGGDVAAGDVVLDLQPLADRAVTSLAREAGDLLGLDPSSLPDDVDAAAVAEQLGIDPDRLSPTVVLVEAEQLAPWRAVLLAFDRLVVVLPIVAVLLAAGAVWTAPRRRSGVLRVGVAVGLSMLVTIPVLAVVERRLVAGVATASARDTVTRVVDVATADLRVLTWVLVAASLLVVLAAGGALRRGWESTRADPT